MSKVKNNLQDEFLNILRRDKIAVSVFLLSGIKLQGVIECFDLYSVVLHSQVNQLIYKHAISTIVPNKVINLQKLPKDNQE